MVRTIARRALIEGNTALKAVVPEATDRGPTNAVLTAYDADREERTQYLCGMVARPIEIVRDRLGKLSRKEYRELNDALAILVRDDMSNARERASNVNTALVIFHQLE